MSPPFTHPFCHPYRAELLNEGGSPGPRACPGQLELGQLWPWPWQKSDPCPLPVGPLLPAKRADLWLCHISKDRERVLSWPSLWGTEKAGHPAVAARQDLKRDTLGGAGAHRRPSSVELRDFGPFPLLPVPQAPPLHQGHIDSYFAYLKGSAGTMQMR